MQAWWNSTPQKADLKTINTESRIAKHRALTPDVEPKMPDVDEWIYLVDLLHEAGTCSFTDGTYKSLSWLELNAWMQATGYVLTSWESSAIMRLSIAYAQSFNAGRKEGCPMPMQANIGDERRKNVAEALKSGLRKPRR